MDYEDIWLVLTLMAVWVAGVATTWELLLFNPFLEPPPYQLFIYPTELGFTAFVAVRYFTVREKIRWKMRVLQDQLEKRDGRS